MPKYADSAANLLACQHALSTDELKLERIAMDLQWKFD